MIKRGDIYYLKKANRNEIGSEQSGSRPVIIVSNDKNNTHSKVVEYVSLTTQKKTRLPTHVRISSARQPSIALCEQIQSVSIERLEKLWGHVSDQELEDINNALKVSLGL